MPPWFLTLNDDYRRALQSITGDGSAWILAVFRWAVVQLVWLADVLGVSYETLNVWLFVVLLPGALLGSLALNVYLLKKVKGHRGRSLGVGLLLACLVGVPGVAQGQTRTVTRYGVFRVITDVGPESDPNATWGQPVVRLRISRDGVRVLAVSSTTLLPELAVDPMTGRDVTGDGEPDVVLRAEAGGNHSGDDIYVYAGTSSGLRRVGHLDGYGCATRLADLDGDGVPELVTCDPDGFEVPSAPASCPEVARPRPTVIYRFDPAVQRYRLATPDYRARRARTLRREALSAVQAWRRPDTEAPFSTCAVWSAGLELLYSGDRPRAEQTLRVLHADARQHDRFKSELWGLLRKRWSYLATARPDAPLLPQ